MAKRKRGSHRRRKAVAILAKKHARVARVRRDFHHKTARKIVDRYDFIAMEDLNVQGLARGMLARSVHDAGWGSFQNILVSKAASAGREVVKVNPAGTSQTCSAWVCDNCEWAGSPSDYACFARGCPRCASSAIHLCGHVVKKNLSVRMHSCPACGYVVDRDVNAGNNILRLGRGLRRGAAASGHPVDPRSPCHA